MQLKFLGLKTGFKPAYTYNTNEKTTMKKQVGTCITLIELHYK